MKTKNIFKTLAFAMMMPAMLLTTACSSEDELANNKNIDNTEAAINKGFSLPVTVNVTRQGDSDMRAVYNESTRMLSFSAGDKLFVEGRDIDGAEYFAGALDYDAVSGKFTGTIYTQNEWTGTADELFVAANADQTLYVPTFIATLLPADYEDYGYFGINDKGDEFAYNDRVKDNINYTLATSKAAGVEQLSWERATSYSSVTGFALEARNAILNFTVTGLEANTDVDVLVRRSETWYIGTKTIKTDNDGNATFVACYPYGNNLQDCTVTVDGTPITIVSSAKNVERGKIYNITRVKPTAVVWNLSDPAFSGYVDLWGGFTHEGVKLKGDGNLSSGNLSAMGDGLTFTNTLGKKFKSIVISTEYGMADIEGDGWSGGTWTGNAESVTMTGGMADGITSITFLLGN
ncbi:MAG: hypothetical protein IJV09_07965 [Prevotella sp.]|nr:hypothetical protein [Prevotella sp.]